MTMLMISALCFSVPLGLVLLVVRLGHRFGFDEHYAPTDPRATAGGAPSEDMSWFAVSAHADR